MEEEKEIWRKRKEYEINVKTKDRETNRKKEKYREEDNNEEEKKASS
jgi:hypothetical protein